MSSITTRDELKEKLVELGTLLSRNAFASLPRKYLSETDSKDFVHRPYSDKVDHFKTIVSNDQLSKGERDAARVGLAAYKMSAVLLGLCETWREGTELPIGTLVEDSLKAIHNAGSRLVTGDPPSEVEIEYAQLMTENLVGICSPTLASDLTFNLRDRIQQAHSKGTTSTQIPEDTSASAQ